MYHKEQKKPWSQKNDFASEVDYKDKFIAFTLFFLSVIPFIYLSYPNFELYNITMCNIIMYELPQKVNFNSILELFIHACMKKVFFGLE